MSYPLKWKKVLYNVPYYYLGKMYSIFFSTETFQDNRFAPAVYLLLAMFITNTGDLLSVIILQTYKILTN